MNCLVRVMSEPLLSSLDKSVAAFFGKKSNLIGEEKNSFVDLVAKLSSALRHGHTCLPVSTTEKELLAGVHLVSDKEHTPLVLCNGNLYLQRYYVYEKRFAIGFQQLARASYEVDEALLVASSETAHGLRDSQKQAARLALSKGAAIICGGPGTGKTTTVVKILALLLQSFGTHLKIALAAPTGKAAMRLADSVSGSLDLLDASPEVIEAIPVNAQTLHRLLGYQHGSPRFLHNNSNPMGWDVVVIDEASMVDLAMMSKLVDAMKRGARLVLLGDKDQLASVESGSVLSDLMTSLPGNSIELLETFRFDDNIKKVAQAINRGDENEVWSLLVRPGINNVSLLEPDSLTIIGEKYLTYMETVKQIQHQGINAVFREFNNFQVLCAVHYGAMGVEGINRRVEMFLRLKGYDCVSDRWYPGRPVLITQNDYRLELFNGDIGICLPAPDSGSLRVYFQKSNDGFRSYNINRLSSYETVYAMTIHKSQGSEFDQIVVILPKEKNKILCRELVYTGVTRAKKTVSIVAGKEVLGHALGKTIKRNSGLQQMLKNYL